MIYSLYIKDNKDTADMTVAKYIARIITIAFMCVMLSSRLVSVQLHYKRESRPCQYISEKWVHISEHPFEELEEPLPDSLEVVQVGKVTVYKDSLELTAI